MPTFGLRTLEALSLFEKHFVIPFLDFSPISLLHPRLLKEYFYGQYEPKIIPKSTLLPIEVTIKGGKRGFPNLKYFEEKITRAVGFEPERYIAFGRKLYAVGKKRVSAVPHTIIPYASWISKARIPVSVIRAYSEEVGAFYRGTYEETRLGRIIQYSAIPDFEKGWQKWFLPRWKYAATETFFEKIRSAVLWPREWKKIQKV